MEKVVSLFSERGATILKARFVSVSRTPPSIESPEVLSEIFGCRIRMCLLSSIEADTLISYWKANLLGWLSVDCLTAHRSSLPSWDTEWTNIRIGPFDQQPPLLGYGSLNSISPTFNRGAPCSASTCLFEQVHALSIDFSALHCVGVSE